MTEAQINLVKRLTAAVVLLGVGAGAGYWWARRSPSPEATVSARSSAVNSTGDSSAPSGERRILYWHDPMVPEQKFDKPGKSPFMDMDLVPVYADEVSEGGDVRVSPSVVQNLGIRLARVERQPLDHRLRAVGSVAFDQRLLEAVQARVDGYVTRLYVKATLERVRRGEPLAEILAPQWQQAEQEYLALLDSTTEGVKGLRDAARQRLVVLGVPEATIRAIETTRKTHTTSTVVAPIDGVVTGLGVRQGTAFTMGASLFEINGVSTVWVNAQIPESQVSMAPVGSTVEARATGWPATVFKGKVDTVLPEVDPQTRTITARVSLQNTEDKLSPGMYVTLDLAGRASEPQLVVPSEAIIATGARTVVIVAKQGGGFDVVDVTLGAEQGGRTAVLSGLTEGQSIVVSGQFLIDSEASLRSAVHRLESSSGSPAEPEKSE